MRGLLRSRSARIAGLALLAVLSLVPLPLLALPYGSLDWVVYDPAYREGHSWPVPPGRAPALEIPCAEFPEPDEPLVAVVNGLEIGRAAFQREMDQFLLALQTAGHDVTGEIQPRLPEFRRQVLELMIEDILIQQAAVELGIGIDEESIAAQVAAQVEQGGGLELFQVWLEQTGQTWEEFRRDTCQDLLRARVEEAVGSSAAATVEMVQARQIVVPSQEDAVRVLIRLASGEPFADVAREASVDDATREQGGDLGWFFRGQGVADAQVEALAFAGQPGQVKGPVAVPEGYVIVQTVTGATQQVPDPETRASLQALAFLRSLKDRRQGADVQVLVDVE